MEVAVTIPDKFVENRAGISREMLESYAAENLRLGRLSLGQFAELLDFSIDEAHAFVKERRIPSPYDLIDLERDRMTVETLLGKC